MRILNRKAAAWVAAHPMAFFIQCINGFRANQGLLLAGAVAYYSEGDDVYAHWGHCGGGDDVIA